MKLVSPKTLLASLMGVAFVVMKVMTFDGVSDLFWIGLFGYWTIKGFIVAFSQEAYNDDVKKRIRAKPCIVICSENSPSLPRTSQLSRSFWPVYWQPFFLLQQF